MCSISLPIEFTYASLFWKICVSTEARKLNASDVLFPRATKTEILILMKSSILSVAMAFAKAYESLTTRRAALNSFFKMRASSKLVP